MIGWCNNFGLIESGNGDVDFISIGLAHESQRTATGRTERADAPGPCDFPRFAVGKLKIFPSKRRPSDKRRTSALATIFAMTMSDVVRLADALVSNSAAQAAATDHLRLLFHR